MTWLIFLLGTVAAATFFVAGYLLGMRSRQIDASSFWQGFADGEAFATSLERTPSPN